MALLRAIRRLAARAACGLAFVAVAGVVSGLAAPAAHAASLRVASAFDPQTMDPHSLALQYHTRVAFTIYESLVGHDQDYRLVPVLASEWHQVDALTWRFRLRADVHFHDGSLFGADDAVFSLERAMAPPSQRQFVLKGVRAVRKVDAQTIDVVLSEPDAVLPQKLALVAMMSRQWCIAHGVQRAQDFDARQETFAVRNANGTGAYQLVRYEPDIRTVMKAFPQWWNRRSADNGNVDEVSFVTIRSDATRLAALHSGEVDLVLDPPYQDIEPLRRDPGLAVTQVGDLATDYLAFDQSHDALAGVGPGADGKPRNPFKDLRVRRAAYQAINIDLIIQKVLRGLATPAGTLLAPAVTNGRPEVEGRMRYDPASARSQLAQAGYPNGFDVTMDCVNVAIREHVCQAMAAMLTQVGIRARLRTSPTAQFFPMITQGTIGIAEFGFTSTADDPWQSLNALLHTWDRDGGGTFNAGRYANPRLDALIDALRSEKAPDKRRALVDDALRMAADDIAYVPLYRRTLSWVMQKKVHVVMWPDDTLAVRWVNVK